MLDRLDDDDAEHFEAVKRLLDTPASPTSWTGPSSAASTTTRGRSSSSSPTRSARSPRWAAAAATTGSSRSSAGRPTPAVGWAAGSSASCSRWASRRRRRRSTSSSSRPRSQRERALALATKARRAGVCVDLDLAERSDKGQMKQADRSGARARGDPRRGRLGELRHMRHGEERELDVDRPARGDRARAGEGGGG